MKRNVLMFLVIIAIIVVLIGLIEAQKTGFVTAFIGGFPSEGEGYSYLNQNFVILLIVIIFVLVGVLLYLFRGNKK